MRRLGVVLILLVFVASAGLSYVLFKGKKSSKPPRKVGGSTTVFTVAQDSPAGIVLDESLVAEETVETSQLDGSPATQGEIAHAVIASTKKKGEVIHSGDLMGQLEPGPWSSGVTPWQQVWWHTVTEEQKANLRENSLVEITQVFGAQTNLVARSAKVVDLHPRFVVNEGGVTSLPSGILLAISRSDGDALARVISHAGDTAIKVVSPNPDILPPVALAPQAPAVGIGDLDETYVPAGQQQGGGSSAPSSPPPPPPPSPPVIPVPPPCTGPSSGGGQQRGGALGGKVITQGEWREQVVTDFQTVQVFEGGKKREIQIPLRKRTVKTWVPREGPAASTSG
ncbi:MAG: hypothetical protein AUJ92_08800 [Armatimonadetes bacterium CG2_30_59_28]|nr:hypothetical protein [Armatimonadota bacterium]OIO94982.1 MAG: hypothetical protein AUJ92_08800 [Armatimonadetes bacterium CG2_30_59_28]PIU66774.1 MAG: hypothetical protein COS85_03380 [Armatimonadetes bacterium CG07_land_8_20_14_0_80_59_28]PIX39069.1 MAG: hypothetical protein COZ56_18695 [Armatimonadetes bacterium CG_4_8_14_3_um_filter_58_9]